MGRATPTLERPKPPPSAPLHGHDRGGPHWESWLLRAVMAGLVIFDLAMGNRNGATVAGMGLALSMIPPLITWFSRWQVPRMLELTFVVAMFLQFVSESLKLFELFTYWDKIVHPAEIFLGTAVATFLLLGYRHRHQLVVPDGLAAFGAMLFGMALGASWELVEFGMDWFGNANLQKSNADTLTDILTNDAGAIFGALFAFWWWRHRATEHQKEESGAIADWLTERVSGLFKDHGALIGIVVALLFGALVFAGWLMDRRPLPPLTGAPGAPRAWDLTAAGAPVGSTAVLLGDWQADQRGICRVNADDPAPGSEKMGLLALAPGAVYVAADGFTLTADLSTARPPLGKGTAIEAGLAFGVRGPEDFYLLQLSATHDTLTLERYLHGRKRDVREERVRTRGDDWHQLQLTVRGDTVVAAVDGRPIFEERGLVETTGGIGLWARVSSAGCFRAVRVNTPAQSTSATAPPNTSAGSPAA